MQNFMTPGNISVQLPEGIDYSVYACGDVVDLTLFGVVIRVTPDSIGASFEGDTECAMVYAPKQAGLRSLGYINGASGEQNLTARWDSLKRTARLYACVEYGPQIFVTLFESCVTIEIEDLVPEEDLDEIVGEEPLTLTEELEYAPDTLELREEY